MQDTCKIHRIRILITNPPKFDNKPHVTRTGTGARTCAGTQAQRAQAPAHQAQESARHVHTHMHMRVGDFMDIWCQAFRAAIKCERWAVQNCRCG